MNNILSGKLVNEKNTSLEKLLLILSNIILNIVIMVITYSMRSIRFDEWLLPITILSLFQLFINLFAIAKLEKCLFSLTVLFFLFSYITHLGTLVIFGFRINIFLPWNPLDSITADAYIEACNFTIFSHAFLMFGFCFSLKKCRHSVYTNKTNEVGDENKELFLLRSIGTVLIILGILPMLYVDINRVILYIKGGYLSTYNVGTRGFITTIGRMTEIGALMLLIGNKRNIKKVNFIILVILLYQSIIMFTGNRGRPAMYVITVAFVYFNFIKKIKIKDIFGVLMLGYISCFLLTFIGRIRIYALSNINAYVELAKKSLLDFSPIKIFAEFGMTIITLARSIMLTDNTGSIQLGTTYLVSIFSVFPNIGGILFPIINKAVYVYSWPESLKESLGGSYLGELYWNFGQFSFVFAFFIGILLAFVSNQIYKFYVKKKYVLLSIYLILFPNLLWWVRDYFYSMVREFVWITLIILILYIIFNEKIRKQKTGNEYLQQ